MVEVCEGALVAMGGWVLTDRHDLAPCAANSLHRATMSVNDVTGGMGTLGLHSASRRHVTESTMLMLGSMWHALKAPCPSVKEGWAKVDESRIKLNELN